MSKKRPLRIQNPENGTPSLILLIKLLLKKKKKKIHPTNRPKKQKWLEKDTAVVQKKKRKKNPFRTLNKSKGDAYVAKFVEDEVLFSGGMHAHVVQLPRDDLQSREKDVYESIEKET